MNFKWIKIQTHIHTKNSDGSDTLIDMVHGAENTSVDAMFLTDHNTEAGYKNIENISKETKVNIIKGIEYTTFYGHIVSTGAPYYRWERLKNTSLNELADFVHEYNGILGIAHPRGVGDPVCTGGSFNFTNVDFTKIDFVEVWHGVYDKFNEWEKNKEFWEGILNDGRRITALYGGDFHRKEHFAESGTFNWLLIDTKLPVETAVNEAIKAGRVIMSQGPCFNIKIEKNSDTYYMGDIMELNENDTSCNIILDINPLTISNKIVISLVDNTQNVKEIEYNENNINCLKISINKNLKWIRAEISDSINKKVLAVCNPIYFKARDIR